MLSKLITQLGKGNSGVGRRPPPPLPREERAGPGCTCSVSLLKLSREEQVGGGGMEPGAGGSERHLAGPLLHGGSSGNRLLPPSA